MTKVTVLGEPMTKERAKVVSGIAFTPKATKAYEENVAWEYKRQNDKFFEDKRVKVKIEFYFTLPKSK